jgi:hypothetical protein
MRTKSAIFYHSPFTLDKKAESDAIHGLQGIANGFLTIYSMHWVKTNTQKQSYFSSTPLSSCPAAIAIVFLFRLLFFLPAFEAVDEPADCAPYIVAYVAVNAICKAPVSIIFPAYYHNNHPQKT